MKKLLVLLFLLLISSKGFAATASDVRISDNGGDVLSINSDGTIPVSQNVTLIVSGSVVAVPNWSYTSIRSSNTTTIKSGGGILHSVVVNSRGAAPGQLTLFDGTNAAGAIIASLDTTVSTTGTYLYDLNFTTGLFARNTGTTSADTTITWR